MKFGSLWDPESHRSNPKPSTKPVSSVCSLLPASLEVGGVMTKLISRNTVILSLMFWLKSGLVDVGFTWLPHQSSNHHILRHFEAYGMLISKQDVSKYHSISYNRYVTCLNFWNLRRAPSNPLEIDRFISGLSIWYCFIGMLTWESAHSNSFVFDPMWTYVVDGPPGTTSLQKTTGWMNLKGVVFAEFIPFCWSSANKIWDSWLFEPQIMENISTIV